MSKAPAVDYALQIIEILAASNKMLSLTDISRQSGINKNAVSRVLGALCEYSWAYRKDDGYAMTLKPFCVSSRIVSKTELSTIAFPVLKRLWEETGDSCYIGVRQGRHVCYTLHMASTHDISVAGRVGGLYDLHCSAAGKILLASASPEERSDYAAHYLERKTGKTIIDPALFLQQLEEIAARGYAEDDEEGSYGIICFAAPIRDYTQKIVAAIGLSSATIYSTPQSLREQQGQLVLAAAEEISRNLGYIG